MAGRVGGRRLPGRTPALLVAGDITCRGRRAGVGDRGLAAADDRRARGRRRVARR